MPSAEDFLSSKASSKSAEDFLGGSAEDFLDSKGGGVSFFDKLKRLVPMAKTLYSEMGKQAVSDVEKLADTPTVPLTRLAPESLFGKKEYGGALEGGLSTIEGLSTPKNMAILAVIARNPSLAKWVGAGFLSQMAASLPQMAAQRKAALARGDTREAAKIAAEMALTGGLVTAGGAHGIRKPPELNVKTETRVPSLEESNILKDINTPAVEPPAPRSLAEIISKPQEQAGIIIVPGYEGRTRKLNKKLQSLKAESASAVEESAKRTKRAEGLGRLTSFTPSEPAVGVRDRLNDILSEPLKTEDFVKPEQSAEVMGQASVQAAQATSQAAKQPPPEQPGFDYSVFDTETPTIGGKVKKAFREIGSLFAVPTTYVKGVAKPVVEATDSMKNARNNLYAMLERWRQAAPDEKSQNLIGFILDKVPAEDLIHKPLEWIFLPQSSTGRWILTELKPAQVKVVREVAAAFRNLGYQAGLKSESFMRSYLTHTFEEAKKQGMVEDVEALSGIKGDILKDLTQIPQEIRDPYLKERKGAKGYTLNFLKAFEAYMYPTLRKAYLEPVLQRILPEYEYLKEADPQKANYAADYINDILGRKPNLFPTLAKAERKLVSIVYGSTLYGNVAAGLTNATQFLTNSLPEVGTRWVAQGLRQFFTKEGQQLVKKSGIVFKPTELGAGTAAKTEKLDFMTQAEYWNRGITYLAERAKQIAEHGDEAKAHQAALDMVRKTQFNVSGADMPKALRIAPSLTQFLSFPIKQADLVLNQWARNGEWGKVGRFMAVSYILGGPKTVVPFYETVKDQMPQEVKDKLNFLEDKTNLSGWTGINLSGKFGLGMFPAFIFDPKDSSLPPLPKMVKTAVKTGIDVYTGKRRTPSEIARPIARDVASLLVKGGATLKKMYDIADEIIRGGQYDERNRLVRETTPGNALKRMLGEPVERTRTRESAVNVQEKIQEMQSERARVTDMFLAGDSEKAAQRLAEWNGARDADGNPKNVPIVNLDLKGEAIKKKVPLSVRQLLDASKMAKPTVLRGWQR